MAFAGQFLGVVMQAADVALQGVAFLLLSLRHIRQSVFPPLPSQYFS